MDCTYLADAIFKDTILSFIVTNQLDYQSFVESIIPKDFHMEVGFASDAIGLNKYILFGVQYFQPYEIFCVDLSNWQGPSGFDSCRHEYRNLLKDIKSSNFTPPSWLVTPVNV